MSSVRCVARGVKAFAVIWLWFTFVSEPSSILIRRILFSGHTFTMLKKYKYLHETEETTPEQVL